MHAYKSKELRQQAVDALPVFVIGAGAAGLAAAFKLKQAGHSVKIIEAAHVVGGKLRSKSRDGFVMDQGAFFLPTTHRRMVELAAEAGFADQIEPGGSIIGALRDGRIHQIDIEHAASDFLRTGLFSITEKFSLFPLAREMFRARRCSYERVPEMGDCDDQTAASWARNILGNKLADHTVGMFVRGMSAASAESSSRVDFLSLLSFLKGAQLIACRGGFGAYAANLSAGISSELNARAKEVVAQGNGVRVTWCDSAGVEHVERAAGCVVATDTYSAINMVPELDPWRKAYMGCVRDQYSIILCVAVSRPPANHEATYVLVPDGSHPVICGISADHNKAIGRVPPGKGMFSVMPASSWCGRRFEEADDKIIREMVDELDRIIPGIASTAEFAEITRWTQRYNPVGYYRDLGRFRALCEHRDTVIQLAGDYFGYTTMETAIRSGEAAARNLVRALSDPKRSR